MALYVSKRRKEAIPSINQSINADRCQSCGALASQYKWSHLGWSKGESEQSVLYGVETSSFLNNCFLSSRASQVRTEQTQQQPDSTPAHQVHATIQLLQRDTTDCISPDLWLPKIPTTKFEIACSSLNSCPLCLRAQTATDWCLAGPAAGYCWLRCLSVEGTTALACVCEKDRHFEHRQ